MSGPFILRPIATTLLFVAVVLLGMIGYQLLPAAPLPNVDFPTIEVTTTYPGASPDVVETSITAPLEHYFGEISGLTAMNSTSSAGTSQITLQFALSRKIDAVVIREQAQVDPRISLPETREPGEQPSGGEGADHAHRNDVLVAIVLKPMERFGQPAERLDDARQQ